MTGRCKHCEVGLFSVMARSNGTKLRRFLLSARKHLSTVRVTKNWHRLSREAVKSPSSMIFKSSPDTILANWPSLTRDVGPDVPSILDHPVIIWLQFLPPCIFHHLSIPSLKAVTIQHYCMRTETAK